jgi:hypothetical protein
MKALAMFPFVRYLSEIAVTFCAQFCSNSSAVQKGAGDEG